MSVTSASRRGTGAGTRSTETEPSAANSTIVDDLTWFRSPNENANGEPE